MIRSGRASWGWRRTVLAAAGLVALTLPALAQSQPSCKPRDAACLATRLAEAEAALLAAPGPESLARRAEAYRAAGNLEAALVDLDLALALAPQKRPAQLLARADVLMGLGRFADAATAYDAYVRAEPARTAGYHRRALARRALRDFDRAIADYDRALELDGEDVDAHAGRGLAHVGAGKLAQAVADFTRAIMLDADEPLFLYHRAQAWRTAGMPANAVRDYDAALKISPDDPLVLNGRAQAFRMLGAMETALADTNAALRNAPDLTAALFNRASIRLSLGQVQEAIDDLTAVIQRTPLDADAYLARGYVLSRLGKHREALADFDLAIRLSPFSASGYAAKAMSLAALGDTAGALDFTGRALALDTGHQTALRTRAFVLEATGDLPGASALREEAVKQAGLAERAERHRVAALARQFSEKSYADALNASITADTPLAPIISACERPHGVAGVAACAQFLHKRPDSPQVHWYMAQALTRIGDYEGAIQEATVALDQLPGFAQALLERGRAYGLTGAFEKGLQDLDRGVQADPRLRNGYVGRAHTLRAAGRLAAALKDYNKALAMSADDPAVLAARGWTRFASGDFRGAVGDFQRTTQLGEDLYATLMHYVAKARSGQGGKSELAGALDRMGIGTWPAPVGELFLGRATAADVRKAVTTPDQLCEADFYTAMHHVIEKRSEEARQLLARVAETCRRDFYETAVAIAEMKRPASPAR